MFKKILHYIIIAGLGLTVQANAGIATFDFVDELDPDSGNYYWDINIGGGQGPLNKAYPFELTEGPIPGSTLIISLTYSGGLDLGTIYFSINQKYDSPSVGPDSGGIWQWQVDVDDAWLKNIKPANVIKFNIAAPGGGTPVPLPTAGLLLGCGLVGLAGIRRKRS